VDEDEFWALVARLDGVADQTSCRALHDELVATGGGEAFGDAVDEHVERLLEACSLPELYQGDTAEWVAAAVLASGRATYEATLATGGELTVGQWEWQAAEALLVTGFVDPDDAPGDGSPGSALPASLQWNAGSLPDGVTTTWESWLDGLAAAMGQLDHPSMGQTVSTDPEWDAAVAAAGDALASARDTGVHLALVVRDVNEAESRRYSELRHAMRIVPAAEVLAAPTRREVYLRELRALAAWA